MQIVEDMNAQGEERRERGRGEGEREEERIILKIIQVLLKIRDPSLFD